MNLSYVNMDYETYHSDLRKRGILSFEVKSEMQGIVARLQSFPSERSLLISSAYGSVIYYAVYNEEDNMKEDIRVHYHKQEGDKTVDIDERILNIYSSAILVNSKITYKTDNPIKELLDYIDEDIANIILDQVLIYLVDFRKANPFIE